MGLRIFRPVELVEKYSGTPFPTHKPVVGTTRIGEADLGEGVRTLKLFVTIFLEAMGRAFFFGGGES